jgi:hypothetical protein
LTRSGACSRNSPSTAPAWTTPSAPERIARVLDAALARSRPVYLEIPRDMPAGPARGAGLPQRRRRSGPRTPGRLRRRTAGAPARRARRLLMVGVEVRRYALEERVAELARRLRMPVVTSFMGRGLLAHAGVPLAGTYLGLAGDPQVSARVEDSDALLLLGVIVSDTNFAVSARRIDLRQAIHAFDGDVAMGHHVYHQLPMAALVDALLARVPPLSGRPCPNRAPAPPVEAPAASWPIADDAGVSPRHRRRRQRPAGPARPDAAGQRRGRLPVHRHGHAAHRRWWRPATTPPWATACRPAWAAGGHRAAAHDPGGRRRLPDDRLGTGQRQPPRLRPHRAGVQQRQLGDAAHL